MAKSLVFGGRCTESLASYDRESQSWKMSQISLPWGCPKFLDRFPKSGIMQNGVLYQLVNLEHPTREKGSLLLPTPCAHEARLGYQRRDDPTKKGSQKSLTTVIIDRMGGRKKVTGQLNPEFVDWIMGFPIGWTNLEP